MSVLVILIFISLLFGGGFLIAFIWAVKSGQFDDKYTPSIRILFDNELSENKKENNKLNSEPRE